MKKKLLSLLLCGAMLTATMFGCGKSAGGNDAGTTGGGETAKSGDVQVGIVLPTKDEPRWLQDQKQFDKILGDQGFTSKVLFSQGKSETEKSNVEALIEDGVDVLIICAQDTSRLRSATPTAGNAFEMDAIASSYIGGVAVSGGVGKVTNTIIGTLVIMSLTNGMNLMGVDAYMQYIVKGAIFIFAVAFDVISRKKAK